MRGRRRGCRGGGGRVGTSGGGGGVGCGAVARGGGLRRHRGPSGRGGTGGDCSSVLADLLHEIPHEVWGESAWRRQTVRISPTDYSIKVIQIEITSFSLNLSNQLLITLYKRKRLTVAQFFVMNFTFK